jgi:hypothetical protein
MTGSTRFLLIPALAVLHALPARGDEARVAVIGKDLAQILDQAKARVDLADERQAAVAGDVAALEGELDFSAVEAGKMEIGWVTVWHWLGFFWCFA